MNKNAQTIVFKPRKWQIYSFVAIFLVLIVISIYGILFFNSENDFFPKVIMAILLVISAWAIQNLWSNKDKPMFILDSSGIHYRPFSGKDKSIHWEDIEKIKFTTGFMGPEINSTYRIFSIILKNPEKYQEGFLKKIDYQFGYGHINLPLIFIPEKEFIAALEQFRVKIDK